MQKYSSRYLFRLRTFFGVILFLCNSILILGQQLTQQPNSNAFQYEDCGCEGTLDLIIFNGINDDGDTGLWGGQELSNTKEDLIGAVTIANLNDTDGDGDIDKDDADGVESSDFGTNEIDLMKLIIKPNKKFASSGECSARIEYEGNIKFYSDFIKSTEIVDLDFPITINSNNGKAEEIVLYVEATSVSLSYQDILIKVYIGTEFQDEVKATAIWVETLPEETEHDRNNSPDPETFGINQAGLLNSINSFFPSARATDLSRYGFGSFSKSSYIYPSGAFNDDFFTGGRILLKFEILPFLTGNQISDLGIKFDIARRKFVNDEEYDIEYYKNTSVHDPIPPYLDQANDDDQTQGGSDYLDEDNTPMTNRIFSFDNPSCLKYLAYENGVPKFPFHKVIRQVEFEEYVRVSFRNTLGLAGNGLSGSRSSEKLNWKLNGAFCVVSTKEAGDPYNGLYHYATTMEPGSVFTTQPVFNGDGQAGNGSIVFELEPFISEELFALKLEDGVFKLYNKFHNDSAWGLQEVSQMPTGGVWSLNQNPFLNVTITNGSHPFKEGDTYLFRLVKIPATYVNVIGTY